MKIKKFIIINKKKLIIVFVFVILFIGGLIIQKQPKNVPMTIPTKEAIVIEIRGEVKYFGCYEVSKNTPLLEIISLAGGLTANADQARINFNQILNEDALIIIEKKTKEDEQNKKRISLNTATMSELMTLKGIGEAKAKSIIDYRLRNGAFLTIYDLTKVNGISQTILENIIDDICV